jgi:hypothetical protein
LQRFIGILNYDRMFVKDISNILKTFYKLLEKNENFHWGEEEKINFEKVKEIWRTELELLIPDMKKQFVLETDASQYAIGGCLKQEGRPIGYISRTLTKAEMNYSITEREALAAIWSMEKFRYYLAGKRFVLDTDHKSLEYIQKKAEFGTGRINRWLFRLSQFDFEVRYVQGKDVICADALSRSRKNEDADKARQDLLKEKILSIHLKFCHRKNILEQCKGEGIVVSKNDLDRVLKECEICLRKDEHRFSSKAFIQTQRIGEIVAFDFLEIAKNQRVLLCIDYFSRKIFGKLLTTKSSDKVLEFIKAVYEKHSFEKMLTDNGKEFCGKNLDDWTKENRIEHKKSVPYLHQGNGRIERANRTIRNAIKKTKGCLRARLQDIIDQYNNTIHRGIGMSPNEAMLSSNYEKVILAQERYCKEFDKKASTRQKFEVDDEVLIKNEKLTSKMDDVYKEKGKVTEKIESNVYKIRLDDTSREVIRHASQMRILKRGKLKDEIAHGTSVSAGIGAISPDMEIFQIGKIRTGDI